MPTIKKSILNHNYCKYCGKKIPAGLRKSCGDICGKNLRKECRRRWREKNLEKLRKYRRKLRKEHPEKVRGYQRKWIEKKKKNLREMAKAKKF